RGGRGRTRSHRRVAERKHGRPKARLRICSKMTGQVANELARPNSVILRVPYGLTARVAGAVVELITAGASRRRGTTRQHVGGPAESAGRSTERPADNRANGTRRPITARRPGRLA